MDPKSKTFTGNSWECRDKERGEGKTSRTVASSSCVRGQQAAEGKSWGERGRFAGSLGLGEGDDEREGAVSKKI